MNFPVVKSSDPKINCLNVKTNKVIHIKFNKHVKFGNKWIELLGNGLLTLFRKNIHDNNLIITPSKKLKNGTKYTLILHYNSIQDISGNGVAYYCSSFKTAVKIDIINHATSGDIKKNSLLYKYIPKTVLSDQIISKAKTGTPMVTFGNGKGPKILIVAGVHGNELPAPAAAMKLINYLNGKTIKGTIYIIPFAIPYCTSHTHRYWNHTNPNRRANKTESPTNIIMKLAKRLHVDALGDFHLSMPGGVPGRDSALCTKIPILKSYKIAGYIAKNSGSKLIAYEKVGVKYPGALEDVCNLNGVPAVTCEVLALHGTLKKNRINKSCNQMFALLKYFNLI
nr:succinylglutamate desuccinylase/aspartoacylase family protein [Methanobacterium spitsbergense]